MKIYRKSLGSLEELKREKIRLRYERRHTNSADLNPLAELGRHKVSDKAKDGLMGMAMELFSAKSNMQTAMAIGKPLLKMLRQRSAKKQAARYAAGMPKKPSISRRVAVEVATGYLLGKGVQMAYRGVQMFIKRRKAARLKKKRLAS